MTKHSNSRQHWNQHGHVYSALSEVEQDSTMKILRTSAKREIIEVS